MNGNNTLNEAQLLSIQIAATAASSLSLLGSAFIIASLARRLCHKTPQNARSEPNAHLRRNQITILILSLFDVGTSLGFIWGPALVPPHSEPDASAACTTQAAFIQFFGVGSILWTAHLSVFILAALSAKRYTAVWLPFIMTILVTAALLSITAALGRLGPATLWCWITESSKVDLLQLLMFYVPLVVAWCTSLTCVILVRREVGRRLETTRRLDPLGVDAQEEVARNVTRQMSRYLLVFVVSFFPGLLNRAVNTILHMANPDAPPVYALSLLHAFVVPLQGAGNAVVYGDVYGRLRKAADDYAPRWCRRFGRACCSRFFNDGSGGAGKRHMGSRPPNLTGGGLPVPVALGGFQGYSLTRGDQPGLSFHDLTHHLSTLAERESQYSASLSTPRDSAFDESLAARPHSISGVEGGESPPPTPPRADELAAAEACLFVGTWNLGEAAVPSAETLRGWLPPDRDVYAIGVQECLNPGVFARNAQAAVGGPAQFALTVRHIGSSQTKLGYHGHICLVVLVASSLTKAGDGGWQELHGGCTAVRRGQKLLLRRAANKGAVGAAFRFHSTTIAFVTCHLAADRGGKKRLAARLKDTRGVLAGMDLEYDPLGFDLPFTCHHVVLLGDLNYRVALPPEEALQHMSHGSIAPLLEMDELNMARRRAEVLCDFREPAIDFLPTYRRVKGAEGDLAGFIESASREDASSSQTAATESHARAWSGPQLAATDEGAVADGERLGSNSGSAAVDTCDGALATPRPAVAALAISDAGARPRLAAATPRKGGRAAIPLPAMRRHFAPRPVRTPACVPELTVSSPAEDANLARLRKAYTLAVSGGGQRTPSYTDRVLFHSLPSRRSQLHCTGYRSDESLLQSDHRPVSADFELRVVLASHRTAMLLEGLSIPTSSSSLSLAGGGSLAAAAMPSVLRAPSRIASAKRRSLRCRVRLSNLSLRMHTRRSTQLDASSSSAAAEHVPSCVERCVVAFPMPAEDPNFAMSRVGALFGKVGSCALHELSWGTAAIAGISVTADVDVMSGAPSHVLLKFQGEKACDVAQGALAIPLPWDIANEHMGGEQAPVEEGIPFELPLSLTGERRGFLVGVLCAQWGVPDSEASGLSSMLRRLRGTVTSMLSLSRQPSSNPVQSPQASPQLKRRRPPGAQIGSGIDVEAPPAQIAQPHGAHDSLTPPSLETTSI